jgi:hypothetical protein
MCTVLWLEFKSQDRKLHECSWLKKIPHKIFTCTCTHRLPGIPSYIVFKATEPVLIKGAAPVDEIYFYFVGFEVLTEVLTPCSSL